MTRSRDIWLALFSVVMVLSGACGNESDWHLEGQGQDLLAPLADTIELSAMKHDYKKGKWVERPDGKNYMGFYGKDHKEHSGNIGFNSFPGSTAKYKIEWVIRIEADGAPQYKITIGDKEIKEGKFPFPGKRCSGKSTKEKVLDLGEHEIQKGDKIDIWGKSTFECASSHGAYCRWRAIRFTKVGEAQSSGGSTSDPPPSDEGKDGEDNPGKDNNAGNGGNTSGSSDPDGGDTPGKDSSQGNGSTNPDGSSELDTTDGNPYAPDEDEYFAEPDMLPPIGGCSSVAPPLHVMFSLFVGLGLVFRARSARRFSK